MKNLPGHKNVEHENLVIPARLSDLSSDTDGDADDEPSLDTTCSCEYFHLKTTPCSEAWASHVQHLGAHKVLSLPAFTKVVEEIMATDRVSAMDTFRELAKEGGIEAWFSKAPSKFGHRLYNLTTITSLERLGHKLQVGLDRGWLKFNPVFMEYEMPLDNSSTDLTGLMWQIALTNWEATRKDLSTAQVGVMARLSLQALGTAVFPPSSREYRPEEVDKALEKTRVVVAELNERMRAEKHDSLPPPQVSQERG